MKFGFCVVKVRLVVFDKMFVIKLKENVKYFYFICKLLESIYINKNLVFFIKCSVSLKCILWFCFLFKLWEMK